MRMTWTNTISCILAICLMSGLVACGRGYGESDFSSLPQPMGTSAAGLWTGATPTGRTVGGLVLNDGSYWVFYTARGNPNVLAGLVQGTGTSHSGSFGSSDTRDFNVEGAEKELERDDCPLQWETGRFTTTYDADYELAPNMNLVAGTYAGLRADNQTVRVTLNSAGTVSGSFTDGCTFAGSFSAHAKGSVFHATVTFGGGACRHGTDTVNGVAFTIPQHNGCTVQYSIVSEPMA
jgi:hypothetical protein